MSGWRSAWAGGVFAISVAGCNSESAPPPPPSLPIEEPSPAPTETPPPPPTTLATATTADQVSSVCADGTVVDAVRDVFRGQGYGDVLAHVGLRLDAFTVDGLDAEHHELACRARLTPLPDALARDAVPTRSVSISYAVRPALTASDGPFIVTTAPVDTLATLMNLDGARSAVAAALSPAPPPASATDEAATGQ